MKNQRVFIGLSGGVDSAVSAALLQREGYDVTGVFIKIWQPEFIECTWREDRLDAMRVAAKLGIPFREIDLSQEYKDEVIAEMLSAYMRGATPNPDVLCNERIKFGHFYRWARAQGADYVATGHYARAVRDGDTVRLLRGRDRAKDQTYFIFRLSQDELAHTLFPAGEYTKPEVRALAASFDLPVQNKPDSQGLCFVGDVTMPEFLSRYITLSPGTVLDAHGTAIGSHDGAALYTIGQRHGFHVDVPPHSPLYVTNVDTAHNSITVSTDKNDAAVKETAIDRIHWLREPNYGEYEVQTRYRETPISAHVADGRIVFAQPHVISRGQAAVFYRDDECVGGADMI